MPRRSLESLRTLPASVPQIYPEPPTSLSKRQAEIWKSIVTSRPVDYLDAAGRILVSMLAAHAESFERITRELQRELESAEPDDARLKLLSAMRNAETQATVSLATRLRLTPQSRFTPVNARRALIDGDYALAEKPWESCAASPEGEGSVA